MRMSATGKAWHGLWYEGKPKLEDASFLIAAVNLAGESAPLVRVRWWTNVLYPGAEYKPHKHDGRWAFVYHLTEGASLNFEGGESFKATPGQMLVFDSTLGHWTDKVEGAAPRVSIAGNLHFSSKPRDVVGVVGA